MAEALKLLFVLAHPDDESLGAGGTLAKYNAEGEFATWLELERERLHGLFRTTVSSHADTLVNQHKLEEAVKTLQRFLEHDALDEEAVQKLLTLLVEVHETNEGRKPLF